MIIDPRGLRDVKEWADFITLPLNFIGAYPRQLTDVEHWEQWAYHLIQSDAIQKFLPPDPRHFGSWIEWADRFNQAVPY